MREAIYIVDASLSLQPMEAEAVLEIKLGIRTSEATSMLILWRRG
jgi:hypothetical protein